MFRAMVVPTDRPGLGWGELRNSGELIQLTFRKIVRSVPPEVGNTFRQHSYRVTAGHQGGSVGLCVDPAVVTRDDGEADAGDLVTAGAGSLQTLGGSPPGPAHAETAGQ
jgi:hypothetical protein